MKDDYKFLSGFHIISCDAAALYLTRLAKIEASLQLHTQMLQMLIAAMQSTDSAEVVELPEGVTLPLQDVLQLQELEQLLAREEIAKWFVHRLSEITYV